LGAVLDILNRAAERVSRELRVPQERDDLVQHAFVHIAPRRGARLELPDESDVLALMRAEVTRTGSRRRAERSNREWSIEAETAIARSDAGIRLAHVSQRLAHRRRGIPQLCPQIVRFAADTDYAARILVAVRAACAVLVRTPGQFSPRQFAAFTLAHIHRYPRTELSAFLGTTQKGVTRTLERIGDRLERSLMARIAEDWPDARVPSKQGVVPGNPAEIVARQGSDDRRRVCARILSVLEEAVRQDPGELDPLR